MGEPKKLADNNLQVQLELYRENEQHQSMIEFYIASEAAVLMKQVIEPQMFVEDKQKIVEVKVEDHARLRVFLANLMDKKNWNGINKHIGNYIDARNKNKEIIGKLNK